MSYWERMLFGTLVVAAMINVGNWRAWLWLLVGASSYILSTAYARAELPLHPFVAALCDIATCILIYRFAREKWELPLFTAFQISVLVNFAMLVFLVALRVTGVPRGNIDTPYAVLLESVNWVALAIIIGAGTARLADVIASGLGHGSSPGGGGHLHWVVHYVFAPTRPDWLWWARGWLLAPQ